MEYKWIFTNTHEEKSYIITDKTLVGIKQYCEIKLWGTDITENDIRFKNRENKYISMRIFREDIKDIKIKINHEPLSKIPLSIHLYDNTYVSIEFYTFKVSKICADKNLPNKVLLKKITKKIVEEYHTSRKNKKCEKLIAKIEPNTPSLNGKYVDGKMIFTNPSEQEVTIDLTS